MKKLFKTLALTAVLVLPTTLPAGATNGGVGVALAGLFKSKPKFLPVHQAFGVSPSQTGDTLTVRFKVTDGHYIYKDKLTLKLPDGVTAESWQFDKPSTMVDDPEFGKVAVFEEDVVATAKLNSKMAVDGTATLTWQGCAKAGLCYPPERVSVAIVLAGDNIAKASDKTDNPKPTLTTPKDTKTQTLPPTPKAAQADETATNQDLAQDLTQDGEVSTQSTVLQDELAKLASITKQESESTQLPAPQRIEQTQAPALLSDTPSDEPRHQPADKTTDTPKLANTAKTYALDHNPANTSTVGGFGLDKNPVLAVFLLFLAGIALAFTACVYPMIPIVANIVAKSHKPTAMQGFWLTFAYGLGVATSYGLLGAVVAWFGRSLGIVGWLQNPWILGGFAVFFVLLALQMWGLIRLSLPSWLRAKFAKGSQVADRHLGRVYGSFLVGALSALVVSPCVSAPLAGALWAVSVQGNVVLGFVALFALGLGLSLPLVIVGTTQGQLMPKAGKFMEDVKHFGGLMLLAVAILLVNRVFLTSFMLLVWAVWFMAVAVFLYRLVKLPFRALGLISGLWSALLLVGVGLGGSDAWQPLAPLTAKQSQTPHKPDIKIHTLAELDDILTRTPKVLVELTADWCIECKIMEKTLFANRPPALSEWQVVKLDITQTTEDSRAILMRYELFGPPALLYYQEGKLVQKQLGEVSRSDFELALQTK